MRILTEPADVALWSATARQESGKVGFVPTMGALHHGHLALINSALRECDRVVASIFVNPLQFNNKEDLTEYPRQPEEDAALLQQAGCHAIFMPSAEKLFADLRPLQYDLGDLDAHWEGPSRPGHFQGVVNVVERLFYYVRPDMAFFGEKDRQQLTIIAHVARELRWPELVVPCPTLRESDGLAMSSRNQRLRPPDRQQAPVLFQALRAVAASGAITAGGAVAAGHAVLLSAPNVQLDYLGIADPETLRPLHNEEAIPQGAIALIAAQIGPVRLIDNIALHLP